MGTVARRDEHRRTLRLDVQVTAWLREQGSSFKFDVDVIDLSVSGFRFQTGSRLQVGQHVFITIPGIVALEAEVAWNQRFIYGAAFERPLHTAVFDHIAAKFRAQRHRILRAADGM